MFYKIWEEEGDYVDIVTNEPRNMMEAEIVFTPEGMNVGWDEFGTIEEAMAHYNIKRKEV